MMSRLYAALKIRRFVSRVSEGLDSVRDGDCSVRVCCVYGLGFGSDVTVVVRLDGSCE
jgi:hypothetical protein